MSDSMETRRGSRHGGKGFEMDAWWEERSLAQKVFWGIVFGIGGIGFLVLMGFAVMWLWNWIMPDLVGAGRLDFWKSCGLVILSSILFKGFGSASSSNRGADRKRKQELRRYMREDGGSAGDSAGPSE